MSNDTAGGKNISDEIGEQYESWKKGDIIFINGGTGTGKSYFILHNYLKWVIKNKWKLLYLVNRKILKKQLEEEITNVFQSELAEQGIKIVDIFQYIKIETYQSIENGLRSFRAINTMMYLDQFDCVVCDECHYFYTDSNFNTGTEISYVAIKEIFAKKIRIYISATIGRIEEYIKNDIKRDIAQEKLVGLEEARGKEVSFHLEADNNGFKVKCVQGADDLINIIGENVNDTKDKWLVFIDSIEKGKNIKKKLVKKKSIGEKEIVFLDTDYEYDKEAEKSVRQIIENKQSEKRIVISTAVMDNGITFLDQYLTNIAIFADTEETFVQMLGRRRGAKEGVNVYICKRDKEHFVKRLANIDHILRYYWKYQEEIAELYIPYTFNGRRVHYIEALWKGLKGENELSYNQEKSVYAQQKILDAIFAKGTAGQYIKKFCCSTGMVIQPNYFSILRCLDLKKYYKEIIKEMEKDENSFLKKQVGWLKICKDEIEEIVAESEEELYQRKQNELKIIVDDTIKNYPNGMTKDENIHWKKENQKILLFFAEDKSTKDAIIKNERPLSDKKFNVCMDAAQLPYLMKKSSQKEDTYCAIIRKES